MPNDFIVTMKDAIGFGLVTSQLNEAQYNTSEIVKEFLQDKFSEGERLAKTPEELKLIRDLWKLIYP